MLHTFYFNITSKGFILRNIHIFSNIHFNKILENIDYLKIRLYLEQIDHQNIVEFGLNLTPNYQTNFFCIKYLKIDNI